MSDQNTIVVTDKIAVGGVVITSFALKAQTFASYLEAVADARLSPLPMSTALFREWSVRHIEALNVNGKPVKFGIADLLMFPAKYARQFSIWQRTDDSPEGSIITDGDGMSSPCLYKLGTQIPLGGADNAKVTELEFIAKTIGDIETVITAESKFDQTDALIRNCATPIGENVKLMRLPDASVSQLTLSDGVMIMQKVLPRFLS